MKALERIEQAARAATEARNASNTQACIYEVIEWREGTVYILHRAVPSVRLAHELVQAATAGRPMAEVCVYRKGGALGTRPVRATPKRQAARRADALSALGLEAETATFRHNVTTWELLDRLRSREGRTPLEGAPL